MGFCYLYGTAGRSSGGGDDAPGGGVGEVPSLFADGTRPDGAVEGSISIDPASFQAGDQPSGKFIFSAQEPAAEEGLLWVQIGSGGVSFGLANPVPICAGAVKAALRHGMIWDEVDAYVYSRGQWTQFSFAPTEVEIVPWATGTDEQIARMVAAMDAGKLSVEDSGWHVGDMRDVTLARTPFDPLGRTQPEQKITLVLGHAGGKVLEDGRTCHFVVLQRGALAEYGMIHHESGSIDWASCDCRKWCNEVYLTGFPKALQPIFKPFKNITGIGRGKKDGTQETIDLFALASEVEACNSKKYCFPDEAKAQTPFEWYLQNPSEIIKIRYGASECCWGLRSPQVDYMLNFVSVNRDGSLAPLSFTYPYLGISPFGCI